MARRRVRLRLTTVPSYAPDHTAFEATDASLRLNQPTPP